MRVPIRGVIGYLIMTPKNGPDRKVKNPGGGNDMGWLDRKGRVWIPNDNNGNHAPHWVRQRKDGNGWDNIYPEINTANAIGIGVAIGVGLWEGVKWGTAILGAPETGGASLGLLAIP